MFGKLPSYSIPDGQEGLRGSNLEKAGCCFFQMGLFDFCRPERSYRESAPSGAVPATAGALSAAVPLFYIAENAMMKEGTRFRRKICGLLPWALLLSLEDVRQLAGELFFFRGQFLYLRQLAGGLFFFRRRKKNQERRHPFEWVDDDLGALPPRPPPPINGRPSHQHLLPALPCRPGETFLVAAVKPYFSFAG